jgi:hypothetical protein
MSTFSKPDCGCSVLASTPKLLGQLDSCGSFVCKCIYPKPQTSAPILHADKRSSIFTTCRCSGYCSAEGLVPVVEDICKKRTDQDGFLVCSCSVPKECECSDGGVSDNGEKIHHFHLQQPIAKCSKCAGMRNAKKEWNDQMRENCLAKQDASACEQDASACKCCV